MDLGVSRPMDTAKNLHCPKCGFERRVTPRAFRSPWWWRLKCDVCGEFSTFKGWRGPWRPSNGKVVTG